MNSFRQILIFCFFLLSIYGIKAQNVGYREIQLTANNFDNRYASYNKSGNRIIFETNRDGHWQIYTMNAYGDDEKQLITSTANDRRPTWHPYRDIVLFESDRSGTSELYQLDLETNSVSMVPIPIKGNKSFAMYAPNGQQIIFDLEDTDKDFDIYIVHRKGKRLKKIIDDAFANMYPHLSPRGDNIIYYSDKNIERESYVIYIYKTISNERYRLTYFKDHSYDPIWSSNGREIAYVASIKGDDPEIYTMRNDGIGKKRITFNNTEDILPNWSPNDDNLISTRYLNGHYQIVKILLKEPLEKYKTN